MFFSILNSYSRHPRNDEPNLDGFSARDLFNSSDGPGSGFLKKCLTVIFVFLGSSLGSLVTPESRMMVLGDP